MQAHVSRLLVLPGVGMVVVALVSLAICRMSTGARFRWFWIGAGLWTLAVALKFADALLILKPLLDYCKAHLSRESFVAVGSLYVGAESAFYEMGITLLAVLIWRELGRNADRAIAVGIGAGVFEAVLLGMGSLIVIIVVIAGVPGTEKLRDAMGLTQSISPWVLFAAPVERIMAILCHGATRALILLGVTHRRWWNVAWGFVIFTYIDSVAGFAHLSGIMEKHSIWWIELAILPAALASIPILRVSFRVYGKEPAEISAESSAAISAD